MKNMKIAYKIFLQSLFVILAFTLTVGWVYVQLKDRLYQDKKNEVRHTVESTWGVVEYFAKQQAAGALTLEQAQHLAKEALRETRFDGDNYFWINDLTPRMVMHPMEPKLDGTDLSEVKDPNGKRLFVEMARAAQETGRHTFECAITTYRGELAASGVAAQWEDYRSSAEVHPVEGALRPVGDPEQPAAVQRHRFAPPGRSSS